MNFFNSSKLFNFIIVVLINLIFCENNESVKMVLKKKSKIIFTDSDKHVVSLKKPAENIVIFPSVGTTILIALDQSAKRLFGVRYRIEGLLVKFFPKLSKITNKVFINKKPNMEELLKINPDLVVAWGASVRPSYKKDLNRMEKFGLQVATFDWSVEKDVSPGHIKTIAYSIGKIKKANVFIEWRNELRKKLKSKIKNIPKKDRLRTFYFFKFKKIYNIIESAAMYMLKTNYPARSKGEKRDWKGKRVNVEQILKWDPEIIFLSNFEKDIYPVDIYKNKLFSEMSAVKNKRIYKMPSIGHKMSVGGDGSHEDPLTWMWMAMILYPDYFNFDLRKEIKTWYKIMYGKIPTENQIDKILSINLNKKSINYKKFLSIKNFK